VRGGGKGNRAGLVAQSPGGGGGCTSCWIGEAGKAVRGVAHLTHLHCIGAYAPCGSQATSVDMLHLWCILCSLHDLPGLCLCDMLRAVCRMCRSWLASCLQRVGGWQGGAAAAALSRSELLYMLYAAARLRVSPGDTLLSASLTRLHRELPAATPAELAGCLSVFIYWWRQQQQQQQQQQRVAGDSSGSSRGRGAAHARSGPVGVMVLLQLRDCLAAVEACSRQFSDEGLLQLLMTCVKVDWAQQQQQQGVCADDQLLVDMHSSIRSLVEVLVDRLPGMSLVQLARVSRTLENGPGSSSSSTRVAWGGSSRPNWYDHLLRQVKAALASRA
jgi:hypothetical protein